MIAIALIIPFAIACGGSLNGSDNCNTEVTGIGSTGVGEALLRGHFYSNESVIIQNGSTQIAVYTPDASAQQIIVPNVPSGTHSWHIIISCDAGRDDLGALTFVVD
jgi:hypothetical protein